MFYLRDTETCCQLCDKEFSCTSAKNKHTKKFHPERSHDLLKKIKRIMCPMCKNDEKCSLYLDLNKYLFAIHKINIEEIVLNFRSVAEFEEWNTTENREVDYARRTQKL